MPTQMGENTEIKQAFQDGASKPIVDNPRLPAMPADPAGEAVERIAGVTMMPEIKETVNVAAKGGERTMEAFKPGGANSAYPKGDTGGRNAGAPFGDRCRC